MELNSKTPRPVAVPKTADPIVVGGNPRLRSWGESRREARVGQRLLASKAILFPLVEGGIKSKMRHSNAEFSGAECYL